MRNYPDDMLIAQLLVALSIVLENPNEWNNVYLKTDVMYRLEFVAKCLEEFLPKHLRSFDVHTEDWKNERARLQAAAVREKKKWLLSPMLDTRDHFVYAIGDTLRKLALGDWDSLDRLDPDEAPSPTAALSGVACPLLPLLDGGVG